MIAGQISCLCHHVFLMEGFYAAIPERPWLRTEENMCRIELRDLIHGEDRISRCRDAVLQSGKFQHGADVCPGSGGHPRIFPDQIEKIARWSSGSFFSGPVFICFGSDPLQFSPDVIGQDATGWPRVDEISKVFNHCRNIAGMPWQRLHDRSDGLAKFNINRPIFLFVDDDPVGSERMDQVMSRILGPTYESRLPGQLRWIDTEVGYAANMLLTTKCAYCCGQTWNQ